MSSSSSHPWTLEVEGFGPIIEAKIESAPLTLLVGDNNSGKSYLAILLWSVYQLGNPLIVGSVDVNSSSYKELRAFFDSIGESPVVLTKTDVQRLMNWAMDFLVDVSVLFNSDKILCKRLFFRLRGDDGFSNVSLQKIRDYGKKRRATGASVTSVGLQRDIAFYLNNDDYRSYWLVLQFVVGRLLSFSRGINVPTYLPASRTGFMQLYGPASAYAIQRFYGSDEQAAPRVKLPVPALEFLEWLGRGPDAEPGPFAGEADILEGLLGGAIEVERRPVGAPTYQYRPAGGESLPMPQVSSLVSELAPIILVLRYAKNLSFLVIEEPEAHLHPKVQRVLARTIVRLVRKGVRIILTTHSDLFCQQINNCLKLGSLSEAERSLVQKQLGYDPSEYLTAEDVRGYSFQNTPKGSVVTSLQNGPFGLDMPTFNQELENILDESRRIEDRMSQSTGGAE